MHSRNNTSNADGILITGGQEVRLLIILFLSSCQPQEFSYEEGGLLINTPHTIQSGIVEDIVQIVEEEVSIRYSQVTNLKETLENNLVIVDITDDHIFLNCSRYQENVFTCNDMAQGINIGGTKILIEHDPCLGYSSLPHELLHSIEFLYNIGTFNNILYHTNPYMFGFTPDTIEFKVRQRSRNLCN